MDVREAITTRRSCRKYQEGEDVTNDELTKILEAGRLAPSWANDQPWRFVVVRSDETKEKLAECLLEGNPATKAVQAAPVVIVLVGVPEEGSDHQGKPFWMVDCGIAGQQMFLQAVELGLGTVWVSLLDSPAMCKVLGLPEEMECVGVFPIGRPRPGFSEKPLIKKKPLEEVAYSERYGQPYAT